MVNFNDITEQWEADGVPTKRNELDLLKSIEHQLRFIAGMARIAICVLVALAIAVVMNIAVAKADEAIPEPVVRNAMFIVENLLVKDFPKLQGYAMDATPPPAVFAELDRHAGEFDGTTIKLESRRPAVCHAADLVHEDCHHALGLRYGMTPRESELVCRKLDEIVTRDPYFPGCAERGL
jgi:hypothetical protein